MLSWLTGVFCWCYSDRIYGARYTGGDRLGAWAAVRGVLFAGFAAEDGDGCGGDDDCVQVCVLVVLILFGIGADELPCSFFMYVALNMPLPVCNRTITDSSSGE